MTANQRINLAILAGYILSIALAARLLLIVISQFK